MSLVKTSLLISASERSVTFTKIKILKKPAVACTKSKTTKSVMFWVMLNASDENNLEINAGNASDAKAVIIRNTIPKAYKYLQGFKYENTRMAFLRSLPFMPRFFCFSSSICVLNVAQK